MLAAIDFGASTIKAAVRRGDSTRIIKLGISSTEIPTAVLRRPKKFVIGEAALNQAGLYPDHVHSRLKQQVTRPGPAPPTERTVYFGDEEVPLLDCVSAVFKQLYAKICDELDNQQPTQLTLTHPVLWGKLEQEFLRAAAEKAEIGAILHLVTEPEAVALLFAEGGDIEALLPLAVFDLGSSTFDSAVLVRDAAGRPAVRSVEGYNVGGDSFDAPIIELVTKGLDIDPEELSHQLASAARHVKHTLTSRDVAVFGIESVVPDTNVYREDFEHLIEPLLRPCLIAFERGIEAVGTPIRTVVLSGGASRVPFVRNSVSQIAAVLNADMREPRGNGQANPPRVEDLVVMGATRRNARFALASGRTVSLPVSHGPLGVLGPELIHQQGSRQVRQVTVTESGQTYRGVGYTGWLMAILTAIAVDRDERLIATGTNTGVVKLWRPTGSGPALQTAVGPAEQWFGYWRGLKVMALAVGCGWVAWQTEFGNGSIYQRMDGAWSRWRDLNADHAVEGMAIIPQPARLIMWGAGKLSARRLGTAAGRTISLPEASTSVTVHPGGQVFAAGKTGLRCYRLTGLTAEEIWAAQPEAVIAAVGHSTWQGRPIAAVALAGKPRRLVAYDGTTGGQLADLSLPAGPTASWLVHGLYPAEPGTILLYSGESATSFTFRRTQ